LLAIDTPEAVARSFDRPLIGIRSDKRYKTLRALREYPHTNTAYPFGESIHFTDKRTEVPAEAQQREIRAFLTNRGIDHLVVEATVPTVEDTFMARMGGNDAEDTA
jgi:hypothetical protein